MKLVCSNCGDQMQREQTTNLEFYCNKPECRKVFLHYAMNANKKIKNKK